LTQPWQGVGAFFQPWPVTPHIKQTAADPGSMTCWSPRASNVGDSGGGRAAKVPCTKKPPVRSFEKGPSADKPNQYYQMSFAGNL